LPALVAWYQQPPGGNVETWKPHFPYK
jgi:hypothetical protein